ncbi:hypothetical protein RRSWK_02716 [Rhodopirellula sp. SWK7]|nr:hypothetical protein RRSWK_02716 [Rhodopirellula sp. SWK7]
MFRWCDVIARFPGIAKKSARMFDGWIADSATCKIIGSTRVPFSMSVPSSQRCETSIAGPFATKAVVDEFESGD